MTPVLSLVVPTFNSAGHLQETLDSIRRQGLSGIEVIIVDGGSRDATLDIVRRNADLVSRWSTEPDQGIYDAINKGIAMAGGELIGVLGSDDLLEPGGLAAVRETWRRSPVDIVAGRALLQDAAGGYALRADEHYGPGARLSGIPFCHNAMFATRAAYGRVGHYDLRYRVVADADWVHRAIAAGCNAARTAAVVVRFRHGGASTTDPARILSETFALVARNFPCLDLAEAEAMFRAVRGWSDVAAVEPILLRHSGESAFLLAAAAAFSQRAQDLATALATATSQAAPGPSVPGLLDTVARHIGRAIKAARP